MPLPLTITWVVLASGHRCRILEERRRGAELRELPVWDCRPSEADERHVQHQKAVQKQRFGFGQSVVNQEDFAKLAERRFLARYAHDLDLARTNRRYERLVLIAPPWPLGVLREELGRATEASVEASMAADLVDLTPADLRQQLRGLRMENGRGSPELRR